LHCTHGFPNCRFVLLLASLSLFVTLGKVVDGRDDGVGRKTGKTTTAAAGDDDGRGDQER
jgi:hypothetical protein